MKATELLVDGFTRIQEIVHEVLEDLDAEQLAWRVDEDANSIAWLIWHLSRVQDDHIADVAGLEQIWLADGWQPRFELPFAKYETGYGQDSSQVGAVRPESSTLLTGYYDAVHARTIDYVNGLSASQLDEVIDDSWDPPVTLGVRLMSVLSDDLQHAGQAAFLRGLLPD